MLFFIYFYTVKRIEQFWKCAIQMLYIIIIIIIKINNIANQIYELLDSNVYSLIVFTESWHPQMTS